MDDKALNGSMANGTEKALREAEEKYCTLQNLFNLFLEYSPVYFFFKDAELRPIALSRNFEEMLGRPMDQILGRTMDELFPPELAKNMIEDDRRIIREDAMFRIDEALGERHFTTIKFPVKQDGKPTLLAGLTLDITDRKNAEEALRQSEAKFRSLFDSMIEGVAIHEMVYDDGGRPVDYRILEVNPAYERQMGLRPEEVRGRLASEVYGEACALCMEDYVAVAAGAPPRSMDAHCLVNDRYFHVGIFSTEPGTFVTVFEDITARRRNEEERQRLEAEFQHMLQLDSLGSLAGGVAHDINNVLQAIHGMASVLKAKCEGGSEVASGLDLILNACSRGGDLVKNLTDFARKGVEEPALMDLNLIVQGELELLQRTTLQRIELEADLESALPMVMGDASAIGNALMNVCVNAIDAMPERGVLRFRTRSLEKGGVELMVEDTGHGMPPDVLARATEPFFTTKPRGKGTGLGLSGVYGTMKSHGGSVEIQSTEGKGTRVFLRFPASALDVDLAGGDASESQGAGDGAKPLRILLIDDDELIRETFPEYMEILGHRVLATAEDGSTGLRRLEAGLEVDVVVLDHNMPGMSGLETLGRLRAMKPRLPVLFCTGYLEDATRKRLKEYARVWPLMKPYSIKDIKVLLGEVGQGFMTES